MDAIATKSLSAFNLDFHGLEIGDITVNNIPAKYTRKGDELTIVPTAPLPTGKDFIVVVNYGGTPDPLNDPSERRGRVLVSSDRGHDSGSAVAALGERSQPPGSRSWSYGSRSRATGLRYQPIGS